eukprot:Opistho-2@6624
MPGWIPARTTACSKPASSSPRWKSAKASRSLVPRKSPSARAGSRLSSSKHSPSLWPRTATASTCNRCSRTRPSELAMSLITITPTALPEVMIVEPRVFGDARGFFTESWNEDRFNQATGNSLRFPMYSALI